MGVGRSSLKDRADRSILLPFGLLVLAIDRDFCRFLALVDLLNP